MKKCLIFGALDIQTPKINFEEIGLIIAADGGLKTLKKMNITPDLIVGDFDSLGEKPLGNNVIIHPTRKNDTDTMLAIKIGLEKGYKEFLVFGCIGGRLDQTIASIQTASFVAENGGNTVFFDGETRVTVIKNSSISFSKGNQGTVSVFAISSNAHGVREMNLLYTLDNAELTPDFPLGVSNEFIGENSWIGVRDGKLCIIWNGQSGNFTLGDIR